MDCLDDVMTPTRTDDATDAWHVRPGWGQGKATFGGLVVGACVRAMASRVNTAERPLRSLSAQLLGAPRPGPTTLRLRQLRASATVTTWTVDLEQDGQVLTHVVGVFGAQRPVELAWTMPTAPVAPPWEQVEVTDMVVGFAPEFTQFFEYRNVGAIPFTGSSAPSVGWFRPRAQCQRRDEGWLACMVDTWWLAVITNVDTFRPAATLTLNAELHATADGLDPSAPLLHRGQSHVMRNGYSLETRELWGADGRLLTTCTELITVIK